MLVMTARVSKKRVAWGCLGLAILICAACLWTGREQSAPVFEANGSVIQTKNLDDAASRLEFLTRLGWEVEEQPIEFMEVQIPREFDEVYTKYNEIQTAQGMDLAKYRGKRVMRYSYAVKNYPGGESGVRANMLVYKNKLIGGDVCSAKLDGFMHGFARPAQ